ncbi:MAG: cobalamin-binding protein [Porticoccaceae bacterium]
MSGNTTSPRPWLALLAILLLAVAATARAEIRLVDDLGHTLVLAEPARRIVSLAPNITESLFAVGAGKLIVATVNYSDYPEAALAIPRIGTYDKINRESLVAMDPDLVIAWESGNGPEVIDHLRRLGLPVFVTEPRRLEDIASLLRNFATLTGLDAQGRQAADTFTARLDHLRGLYSDAEPVSVFYQVWNQPLLTLNDGHLIADVIRLCGGVNIFADAGPLVPVVNTETVLRADPDVIIASGMGEERPDWVDAWRRWPSLRAAQNDQLYFIPPSLVQRNSTRILDGAELMCRYLNQARHSATEEPRP